MGFFINAAVRSDVFGNWSACCSLMGKPVDPKLTLEPLNPFLRLDLNSTTLSTCITSKVFALALALDQQDSVVK